MDHPVGFEIDNESVAAAAITQSTLIDTHERLGAMLDVMPIGLLIHTEQGILFANRALCKLLRTSEQELLGRHVLDFIHRADAGKIHSQLERALVASGAEIEEECVLAPTTTTERLVKMMVGRLPWPGNPVIQILVQDVTDQKRAEHSLRQMAITDELTGAYNRRQAMHEGALYIGHDRLTDMPLSVILVDIDHFKAVNDRFGHAAGDQALRELTRVAHEFVPTIHGTDSAMFARLGGEEFLVLLPGIDAGRAMEIAEELRQRIGQIGFSHGPHWVSFTASMGVATLGQADLGFSELLSRADVALYSAKDCGRNRVMAAASLS